MTFNEILPENEPRTIESYTFDIDPQYKFKKDQYFYINEDSKTGKKWN